VGGSYYYHIIYAIFIGFCSGKFALYGKHAGAVAGCDFSGIVEEIGSNVPQGLRSIGERVAGLVLGGWFSSFSLSNVVSNIATRPLS
jgi:NADPH:quinone reductase-like Zn-dependent oxidoreductase